MTMRTMRTPRAAGTTIRALLAAAVAAAGAFVPIAQAGSGPGTTTGTAATSTAPVLELGKNGLRLLDAAGQPADEFSVRAKRWDRRLLADGTTVALLQDADTGVLRLIEVRGQRLRERGQWAAPAIDVEAICLYLEPRQQTLQAFLLGSDGLSEQWLLTPPPVDPAKRRSSSTSSSWDVKSHSRKLSLCACQPSASSRSTSMVSPAPARSSWSSRGMSDASKRATALGSLAWSDGLTP